MLRPQVRTSWVAAAAEGGKTLIAALTGRAWPLWRGRLLTHAATGRSRWMRVDIRCEGDVAMGRRGDKESERGHEEKQVP